MDTRRIQCGSPTCPTPTRFTSTKNTQTKQVRSTPTEKKKRARFHVGIIYIHHPISHHLSCRCVGCKEPTRALPCRPDQSRTVLPTTQSKKFLPEEPTSSCCILESGFAELAYTAPLDAAGGGPDDVAPPPPRSGLAIRPKFNDVALAFFCASTDHCQTLTQRPVRQLTSSLL